MSKRICGCVYSDERNNSWVRAGKEMSGSIMHRCAHHQAEWDARLAGALVEPTLEQKLARADARIAELEDALECLTLVVGLTAFKHEGQRAALQEAMDRARAVLGGGETGDGG